MVVISGALGFEASLGQKKKKPAFQPISGSWWHIPVISVMQEAVSKRIEARQKFKTLPEK
jgi:hypothetical protein